MNINELTTPCKRCGKVIPGTGLYNLGCHYDCLSRYEKISCVARYQPSRFFFSENEDDDTNPHEEEMEYRVLTADKKTSNIF